MRGRKSFTSLVPVIRTTFNNYPTGEVKQVNPFSQLTAAKHTERNEKKRERTLTHRLSVCPSSCLPRVVLQEAVVVQREDQPVQAAPRQAQRRAGPAGQPAAVPPGRHLQAGQVVGAAPRRLLPPCQELLPR